MLDAKLAMYIGGLVFATGIAYTEFRILKRDFDKHEAKLKDDIKGLRVRKASKNELDALKVVTERDVNGIGKKCELVKVCLEAFKVREDRRFREFLLVAGRMTDDPAIHAAIQRMAGKNGGG